MNDGHVFIRDKDSEHLFHPHEVRHMWYETAEAIDRLAKVAIRDGQDMTLDSRHVLALTSRLLRLY